MLDEVRAYAAEALIFRTWYWTNYVSRRHGGGGPNHDGGSHDGGPGDDCGTRGSGRRYGGSAGAFGFGATRRLNRSVSTRGPYDRGCGSQATTQQRLRLELCTQVEMKPNGMSKSWFMTSLDAV